MSCEVSANGMIGKRLPIRDAALKVTGQLRYVDDLKFPHMLHAKVLFSTVAHGRIKSINTEKAEAMEGVRAVVCYKNAPDALFNSCGEEIDGIKTERIFDNTIRYLGDKVAAVAADTKQLAEKALRLIEVEYEPLPVLLDPEEAMKPDAYPIHPDGNIFETVRLKAGDVEQGMAQADHVFEDRYTLPAIHHSAIETHTAIATYESNGKLTVYSPCQDTFSHRLNLTRIFGLPMSKVRVVTPAIGGGFGGKIDMVVEPVAALLAIKTGRPVKLTYSRKEDIISSRTRHQMIVTLKTGVKNNGTIVAQDMKVIVNAGAYAGGTSSIVWAMSSKYFKNHKTPNLRFTGYEVYTNTQIAGAMRGFGSPQEFFAQQRQINSIAAALNIPVIDMQLKNLVEPDGVDQRDGTPYGNARPIDCVKKGMELFGWEKGLAEQNASSGRYRIGVGMAVAAHGNGVYGVRPDTTGIILKMNEDGSIVLFTGTNEMGNGAVSLQVQLVSEILGISPERVECVQADTDATMWNMGDYSSRGTFVSGHAAVKVAEKIRRMLLEEAGQLLEEPAHTLCLRDNGVHAPSGKSASLQEVMAYAKRVHQRDIAYADTFASNALAVSYGAHFAKVRVDTETGKIEVLAYTAVHDVGKALNPMSVEGQIEGAVQMGVGYALSEGIEWDEKGKVKNSTFRSYHILNATEMPPIRIGLVEEIEDSGPYGAKSIGECSVVPSAPAVINAVSNAVGREFNALPVNPENVLEALR